MKPIYKIIFAILLIVSAFLSYENCQLKKIIADRDNQLERAAEQFNNLCKM